MTIESYLRARSAEVFYTHSLEELLDMAAEVDPAFRKVFAAKKLDRYYIPTRYPNGLPDGIPADVYTEKAAQDAVALAEEVVEAIRERLEGGSPASP